MSLSTAVPQGSLTIPETPRASQNRAVVIGIYGLPGSGKTFLLKQLEDALRDKPFTFFEDSKTIDDIVPGGLPAFKTLPEATKGFWR